jgi:hypothetical protein
MGIIALSQRVFPSQQDIQGRGTKVPSSLKSKVRSVRRSGTAIDLAIFAYATEHAGTEIDLDRDLEKAGIECLARGS